ncbi:ArsR/SmtB family transcription factor [Asanoa siamensis]|uniref:Transcriptional regulator n=1 Tax=Asanoa siamensis TaxID=926357 RepID=A0ABQ4CNU3_9ACTN|nr:helix-turn-helix domain-containing protein [Asanoa siamensis]GIF72517.1 transcriptional regulator [Asanoa siamensis]
MTLLPQPTREQLDLSRVLEALSNPIRQRVVRQLSESTDFTLTCGELLPDLPKSTATHHWRMLRDSGVVGVARNGREFRANLRRADLDARFPGLLDAVLAAI